MSSNDILIRDEQPEDRAAFSEETVAAFATLEISNQTEHFIVLAFDGRILDGEVRFHEAFQADSEAGASEGAASPPR
jgi:hypothetical protein